MEAVARISLKDNDLLCAINKNPEEVNSKMEEASKMISALQLEDESPVSTITEDMIASVMNPNPDEQLIGTRKFRQLLSNQEPDIDERMSIVINLGLIPVFVSFVNTGNAKLQLEAAWVLTNIANGNSDQTKAVIDGGAVPALIQLLCTQKEELQEIAIWALANIAGTDENFRNYIHCSGMMIPLLQLLNRNISMSLIKTGVWCLRNLCRGKKPPPDLSRITPVIRSLAHILRYNDADLIVDICFAFSYLCECGDEYIQIVIDAGVGPRLVELLAHCSANVVYSVLRAIGHIFVGNNVNVGCLLDYITLNALHQLLSVDNETIRRTACWTLSNITAGNSVQLQLVINANIFPRIIEIINTERRLFSEMKGHCLSNIKERYDALWVIRNAIFASSLYQLTYFIQVGCFEALAQCLLIDILVTEEDIKRINLAINALTKIFEVGVDQLHSIVDMNRIVLMLRSVIESLSNTACVNNPEYHFLREYLRNYQQR